MRRNVNHLILADTRNKYLISSRRGQKSQTIPMRYSGFHVIYVLMRSLYYHLISSLSTLDAVITCMKIRNPHLYAVTWYNMYTCIHIPFDSPVLVSLPIKKSKHFFSQKLGQEIIFCSWILIILSIIFAMCNLFIYYNLHFLICCFGQAQYRMPEAYDQDGGVNQEQRFAVALQRYRFIYYQETKCFYNSATI